MTRHIKAHRKFRVGIDILANGVVDVEVVAPDEEEAEEMAQRLIDTGAFNDYFKTSKVSRYNLDISIAGIEDIGNAITGE